MRVVFVTKSVLIVFLVSTNLSFAMHMALFRGAQILGAGYCIQKGVSIANESRKEIKNPVIGNPVKHQQVLEWIIRCINKCDVDYVPVVMLDKGGWAIQNDHTLLCKKADIELLNDALILNRLKENSEFIKKSLSDDVKDTLLLHKIFLFHEMSHLIRQDSHRKICALFLLPVGVQVIASSATYCFNKMCNIKPPKTLFQATMRIPLSVVAIIPKHLLFVVGLISYARHCEATADKFSCEQYVQHAKTARGLEVAYNHYSEQAFLWEKEAEEQLRILYPAENLSPKKIVNYAAYIHGLADCDHPYPRQRAKMYKEYLEKWNKDHEKDTRQ